MITFDDICIHTTIPHHLAPRQHHISYTSNMASQGNTMPSHACRLQIYGASNYTRIANNYSINTTTSATTSATPAITPATQIYGTSNYIQTTHRDGSRQQPAQDAHTRTQSAGGGRACDLKDASGRQVWGARAGLGRAAERPLPTSVLFAVFATCVRHSWPTA